MAKKVENKLDNGLKFFTPYTFTPSKSHCEELSKISDTVPDQSYTPRELLLMHQQGLNPSQLKEGYWDMDTFGEEINPLRQQNFDLSDLDNIKAEVMRGQEEVHKIKEDRAKRARIADKEKIIAQYQLDQTKEKEKQEKNENKQTKQ